MTYKVNIGDHIQCCSVQDVNGFTFQGADVVIGGPPCQGFSNANRRNLDSEESSIKRDLVDEYIRVVQEIGTTKVFVIENVPQFLTANEGDYLNRVLSNFPEYNISYTVVDDYKLGGYTIRKRAILIGSKIGRIEMPESTIHSVKTVKEALSKVDATWFNYDDITKPRPETALKMSYVKQGSNWRDIPPEIGGYGPKTHADIMCRLDENGLAPTILNWRKINMIHPTENRTLSVSEAAALQGFEKDFIYEGDLDSKQQQCGNGVPRYIGHAVKEVVKRAFINYENGLSFA